MKKKVKPLFTIGIIINSILKQILFRQDTKRERLNYYLTVIYYRNTSKHNNKSMKPGLSYRQVIK